MTETKRLTYTEIRNLLKLNKITMGETEVRRAFFKNGKWATEMAGKKAIFEMRHKNPVKLINDKVVHGLVDKLSAAQKIVDTIQKQLAEARTKESKISSKFWNITKQTADRLEATTTNDIIISKDGERYSFGRFTIVLDRHAIDPETGEEGYINLRNSKMGSCGRAHPFVGGSGHNFCYGDSNDDVYEAVQNGRFNKVLVLTAGLLTHETLHGVNTESYKPIRSR